MDFTIFSIQGLILSAAFFFTGLVDSICGGGGLIAFPALMAIGLPAHVVTGTNQGATLLGTITSTLKYAKEKKIHYRSAIVAVPFVMLGSYLGSKLNMIVPDSILEIILLIIIPVIAIFMIFNKKIEGDDRSDTLAQPQILLRAALIGFVMGTYQGFSGPGTGMLMTLGFAILVRLNLLKASGNARFICLFAGITATISFAMSGYVAWKVVAVATIFNIAGNYCGASLAVHKGAKIIKPLMYVVLVLLMIKVVSNLF